MDRLMIIKLGCIIIISAVIGSVFIDSARSEEGQDPWHPVNKLVGKWQGEGAGFGSTSDVTHVWEFVLQEKFLRLSTKSISRKEDKSEEVHEDTGFLSRDMDRGTFVFRQFLTEGFVNTFDLTIKSESPLEILFGYREAESAGGKRARMRLSFTGEDEYDMVLELAGPGKEFSPCQRMHMKKVK
jgi:hypothetical protein